MKQYSRVSHEQRCQIFALLQAKIKVPQIAKQLGFHKTTIYREIKRNSEQEGRDIYGPMIYHPDKATRKARLRFKKCQRKLKVDGDLELLVIKCLKRHWSPEQIAGRLNKEGNIKISHQSIYNFVRRKAQYSKYLCYQGIKHYRHRRNNKGIGGHWTSHISKRPESANNRSRLGHWERDLMYGKERSPILVCTDRKSRFSRLKRVSEATISEVSKATHELLDSTGKKVLSVTNDNGPEFKAFNSIKYPTYFCDPYRPQQRGTVENTIGVIRRFIKKKTDLDDVDLEAIERWLNFRPRKVLDYLCPIEVFYKQKVALAI